MKKTEEYPIHYTAVLDESGRILQSTYNGWADYYRNEYKYDETGNCTEYKRYDLGYGDPELVLYFEYVYEGNRLVEEFDRSNDPNMNTYKFEYDKNGRLIATHDSDVYYTEDTKYSYDEKGLPVLSETTKMWFANDKLESRKSWKNIYTYDKNGFRLTQEDDYSDEHFSRLYTYEYDKAGNMIHSTETQMTYMGDGTVTVNNVIEDRIEYDEWGIPLRGNWN